MTTDWKALCAELVELDDTVPHNRPGWIQEWTDAIAAARAALAEQPVMPTDEELLHVAATSIEPYENSGIATGEYEPETERAVEVYGSELIAYARAVLARWGNPMPQYQGPSAVTTGAWLHPAYEPGDGSADGAQMVELAWWHPQFGCDSLQMVVDNARAVLARWGNPAPQPPAEGEAAELVVDELTRHLLTKAATEKANHCHYSATLLTRAADLLQRQYPRPCW